MRAFSILVLVSLLLPVVLHPAHAESTAAEDFRTPALDFLRANAVRDGRPTLAVAWAVSAVAAAGSDPATFIPEGDNLTLLDWLETQRPSEDAPVTSWERDVLGIAAAGLDPRDFRGHDYVTPIEAAVSAGQIGDPTLLNDDIFGILALHAAGYPTDHATLQEVAAHLRRNQHADGAFGYRVDPGAVAGTTSNGYGKSIDITGMTMCALVLADPEGSRDALDRALDWLEAQQQPDGGFPPTAAQTTSNVQSTAWALHGLRCAGEDPASDRWVRALSPVDWLLAAQEADGGWMRSAWATAEALQTLLAVPHPVRAWYPVTATAVPAVVPRGEPVDFRAEAEGPAPVATDWIFGENASASGLHATHAFGELGVHEVRVVVRGPDRFLGEASVSVEVVNRPPVLDPVGDLVLPNNRTFSLVVTAHDADGDTLTFSAGNLPEGAVFEAETATFTWTPTPEQVGTYPDVRFRVADGHDEDAEAVTLTVADDPPEFAPLGPFTLAEGERLSFTPEAISPAGHPVTITAQRLPDGASFLGDTFLWVPSHEQAGLHQVVFRASDGLVSVDEVVAITVEDVNRPPLADFMAPLLARLGEAVTFESTAFDPDGDVLTHEWVLGDSVAGDGSSVVHAFSAEGTYDVKLAVNDGNATDHATGSILIDGTLPRTTAEVVGDSTADGWFSGSVRVHLRAEDAGGAGLQRTEASLDDGPFLPVTGDLSFPSGERVHLVRYRSVDAAGNTEPVRELEVQVDTLAPAVRLEVPRTIPVLLLPGMVTATAQDPGAGVEHVEFLVDGEVACTDADGSDGWGCDLRASTGVHDVTARATDRVGNVRSDSVRVLVVSLSTGR